MTLNWINRTRVVLKLHRCTKGQYATRINRTRVVLKSTTIFDTMTNIKVFLSYRMYYETGN